MVVFALLGVDPLLGIAFDLLCAFFLHGVGKIGEDQLELSSTTKIVFHYPDEGRCM